MGLVLLGFAVSRSGGFASIGATLVRMRWWLALAVISTFVAQVLRTMAWARLVASYGGQASLNALWKIRLVGEALNYLTVAGPFVGDPAKAWLLRSQTSFKSAASTVALDRYLYALSSIAFAAAVGVAYFTHWGIVASIGLGAAVLLSPVVVARYNRHVSLSGMYAVSALHLLSHLFMVLEVAVILRGLDIHFTMPQIFLIEAATKGMNAVFFFVPARIGVSEGGHAVLLHFLEAGGSAGLMLGIARRIRSLFWSALGLVLLLNFSRAPAIGGKLDFSRYPSEQLSE